MYTPRDVENAYLSTVQMDWDETTPELVDRSKQGALILKECILVKSDIFDSTLPGHSAAEDLRQRYELVSPLVERFSGQYISTTEANWFIALATSKKSYTKDGKCFIPYTIPALDERYTSYQCLQKLHIGPRGGKKWKDYMDCNGAEDMEVWLEPGSYKLIWDDEGETRSKVFEITEP